MLRLLTWLGLLGAMAYAAMLVRDGQVTVFGPVPDSVQVWLQQLPLPTSEAPPAAQPAQPDPRLIRRLALLESQQTATQGAVARLQEQELARLSELVSELQGKWATLAASPARQVTLDTGSVPVRWDDGHWRMEDYFAKRRIWSQRITFGAPFAAPPRVVLGLTRVETGPEGSLELQPATDIDRQGFTLTIQAEEGRPREVKIQWLAFGEVIPAATAPVGR